MSKYSRNYLGKTRKRVKCLVTCQQCLKCAKWTPVCIPDLFYKSTTWVRSHVNEVFKSADSRVTLAVKSRLSALVNHLRASRCAHRHRRCSRLAWRAWLLRCRCQSVHDSTAVSWRSRRRSRSRRQAARADKQLRILARRPADWKRWKERLGFHNTLKAPSTHRSGTLTFCLVDDMLPGLITCEFIFL